MNLFMVESCPVEAARSLCDSHVIKMTVETAQLLSTAHRVVDGVDKIEKSKSGRNIRRWYTSDVRDGILYKATHVNHPTAIWVRESVENYVWAFAHFEELCRQYTLRYNRRHKTQDLMQALSVLPTNIRRIEMTRPIPAMPSQFVVQDHVESYRAYYRWKETKMDMKWKNGKKPSWMCLL